MRYILITLVSLPKSFPELVSFLNVHNLCFIATDICAIVITKVFRRTYVNEPSFFSGCMGGHGCLWFCFSLFLVVVVADDVIYMQPGNETISGCGNQSNPCNGLANSIAEAQKQNKPIMALPGLYSPTSTLNVDFNLTITFVPHVFIHMWLNSLIFIF